MPNQASPLNGQGESVPLMVDMANVAYLPLAGDSPGTPTGAVTPAAATVVQLIRPATAARTSLTGTATADSGTSANLVLAANAARKGATVYNESTAVLYLGLGTTNVSVTSYTVQLPAGALYEIPFGFTGQLRGLWAAVNGAARVTEFLTDAWLGS